MIQFMSSEIEIEKNVSKILFFWMSDFMKTMNILIYANKDLLQQQKNNDGFII